MTESNLPDASEGGPDSSPSEVLDALIVGGGPAGTATAFRAKELGLSTMVIDFDDVMKRIRDYPADKLILPDFGGGDRMRFPAGGECITALQFGPIDKDELCQSWRKLYRDFDVPVRIGVELTGVERRGDHWAVLTWDHKKGEQAIFPARHVVLALGRGVPRRFDIPGNTDGVAYRLDDPARYTEGPVLVVGGGTSAAEAVMAISTAKIEAEDRCSVFWSYRGTKMPRVSKALAERFFETYMGNGNIRHFPESEPVSVVTAPDRSELLSLRVDRKTPSDRPPETVHLEFPKTKCIACIGEDIPEALLQDLGISTVTAGPKEKKMMLVTPLLETQQPNIYLVGDLLSQSYMETEDFDAPPETFRQLKHRGNIKTSLRDGVFLAEVIKQRLEGRTEVEVVIQDADSDQEQSRDVRVTTALGKADEVDEASTRTPEDEGVVEEPGYLVVTTPAGVDAEEFTLKKEGITTLGAGSDRDVSFPQDTLLSEAHASIAFRDGEYFLRDDGSRSGTYLRIHPDRPVIVRDRDLIRLGRQVLVFRRQNGGPQYEHYDAHGRKVAVQPISATTVFGRSGGRSDPDVLLDNEDMTLSRFHMALAVEGGEVQLQEFGSRNGTYLKIDSERKLSHGDVIRIGGQQLEVRLREDLPEKTGSFALPAVPSAAEEVAQPESVPAAPPEASAPAVGDAPAGAPHVTFADQDIAGAIEPSESLLEWADENEVSLDYECWIGMCGCDVIKVVSGAEHLSEVTEKEIKTLKRKGLEPGPFRLACMTRASGPVVVEAAD